jgi:hypothetical protein
LPGRLLAHLEARTVNLDALEVLARGKTALLVEIFARERPESAIAPARVQRRPR